jgi:hypothetical protein
MHMIRNVIVAIAFFVITAPAAIAQFGEATTTPGTVAVVNVPGVVGPAAPATQNTITTTAPVTSETTISVGTIAAQALEWVGATFGAVIGTALTALILKWFKLAGIQISDAARARLQEIVVNGLNASAKAAEAEMQGKGQVEIRNATVAKTVAYVQNHGADTIKQLGLVPTEQKAVEAIKARIETAVADPTVATPAVMDAPVVVAQKPQLA